MGDKFTPVTAVNSQLSGYSVANGQLIISTDTKELYLDSSNSRIKISDVITGTYSTITGTGNLSPLEGKIYFATDTHQLLQATYENNTVVWTALGGGSETEVITNSNATVSIELQDNKIYYLTNSDIASITLTADSNLSYCTLCFTAGLNTVFYQPSGSRCIGYDCSGGVFTPVGGREYQIAVDRLNNILTLYVINNRLDGGNPDGDTVIVENSSSEVSLVLDTNTIYRLTSSSLSELEITGVASGFKYATIIFTSPSSAATTFGCPDTDWYCVGANCEAGEFTPVESMRYNLIIENEIDRIAVYVMEAL